MGCTVRGVCGKSAPVAELQDLLIFLLKGISHHTVKMREAGLEVPSVVNRFVMESLFMTITNANFDKERFVKQVIEAQKLRKELAEAMSTHSIPLPSCTRCDCTTWTGTAQDELERKAKEVGVMFTPDPNIRSLRQMVTYGLKGMAAYAEHAANLGYEDPDIYAFMQQALVDITQDMDVDRLVALVLKTGETGVRTMALLDSANTGTYGHPEITKVDIGVRKNPGILISGHDLRDLEDLLEQTRNTGIDVYTHSEMLPAHYYPFFKQYPHFAGNYGNAWWRQKEEFETFNGVFLFTTNCVVPPLDNASYSKRVFTTGATGYPGFPHIGDRPAGGHKDFSALIAMARKCAPPVEIESGQIVGGFAHSQVFALADKVVDAVKSGAIRKFVVMAGCDGRMRERGYYTEFASKLPDDTVILTAGCAKYRYLKLPLGDIGGIPRVLDAGQCNDSYSLVRIALKLKEVFGLDDVNKLPIVYNISWYEQKAVLVLLALLSLGVKNIHLGPTLPGFLSPAVAKVLVDKFGIAGITTVDEDLKMLMN